MSKIKRTADTFGLTLSGKLGSRPELESEYVERLSGMSTQDRASLRLALFEYKQDGMSEAAWQKVVAAQAALEEVKEKLFAAGYTAADLTKLAMDNT